jgi:GNAT superfamily N-acetyltransferase
MFAKFHYLDSNIYKASTCWCALWGDVIVGFTSIIPFPHGSIKNGWREHRTVVIPDFQGLGIGSKISDTIGQYLVDNGKQYYSKTAHIKLIKHRNNSELWELVKQTDNNFTRNQYFIEHGNMLNIEHIMKHESRQTSTHKFIGSQNIQPHNMVL